VTRCGECDEWWCLSCEQECPTCLIGAGVETGVVVCDRCTCRFCGDCHLEFECVECGETLCEGCWTDGVSLCRACLGKEPEDAEEKPLELPPGFQIWEGEHRDFSKADPKAWRDEWTRTRKPPIWRRLKGDTDGS
jgi:hypothetical protein